MRTVPDLAFLFNHAGHVVSTELTAALAELNTTPRAICVLEHARGAELTQSRLGELAGLDKTTMVVTMDELEAAGLAERRPAPADRRARVIAVTPAGRKKLKQAEEISDRIRHDVLSALPEEDRETFVDALTTLACGRLAESVQCTAQPRRRAPR